MKKALNIVSLMALLIFCISMTVTNKRNNFAYKEKLSEYGLFEGPLKNQKAANGIIPYTLTSPLFSDYAQKLRFIKLPTGEKAAYNPDSVLQFPIGSIIAKTFFYYTDEKKPEKGRRLIETRILVHESDGWIALPYVWDEAQNEAYLDVAGTETKVTYKDVKGSKKELNYLVPNMNQCRNCHEKNGVITPIGPSARQLNSHFDFGEGPENQLKHWASVHAISSVPEDPKTIPSIANYNDPALNLEDRARAYLDINCAHCHNKAGQAQTSGLFLDWKTTDKTAYGFFKTPIAAGRGSGGLKHDIVPGKAEESILWYRMASTDPGVMMPELGRSLNHHEGVSLIKEWINSLQ